MTKLKCKDGGTCHHQCEEKCFRESCCVPFGDSGLDDNWQPTKEVKQRFETAFTTKVGMTRCFAEYEDGDYINGIVQIAWELYQCGHSDAYRYYIRDSLDETN